MRTLAAIILVGVSGVGVGCADEEVVEPDPMGDLGVLKFELAREGDAPVRDRVFVVGEHVEVGIRGEILTEDSSVRVDAMALEMGEPRYGRACPPGSYVCLPDGPVVAMYVWMDPLAPGVTVLEIIDADGEVIDTVPVTVEAD